VRQGGARRAAALAYKPEKDGAPRVTASGRGRVAEKILEAARAAGIPVQEDPALAEILAGLDPGEEIPPETFQAVAEILAFLYRLDQHIGGTEANV
jgi:flagellar biosynthesis protein